MHMMTATEIAGILEDHEDVAVSIGDKWVSAKAHASGDFDAAANYWRKLKDINVLTRVFSDSCKSPRCPHMGNHCDGGICPDPVPVCQVDHTDQSYCATHYRPLRECANERR
jgi:hypothetical protein